MKSSGRLKLIGAGLGMALFAAAAAPPAPAQGASAEARGGDDPAAPVVALPAGATSISVSMAARTIRVIDDPHTGARWLLVEGKEFPAGPGRLLLLPNISRESRKNRVENTPGGAAFGAAFGLAVVSLPAAIRTGDRLVVEENTAVAEVRLEAVALGPAAVGAGLNVRLRIGGKVARAVALGPGRAAFVKRTEARP